MFAQDLLHNLLLIGLGFIGYFILGGMLRESQRLTKAVGTLVFQETGKVRNQ